MFKSGNQQYREKLEECRQELKKGNTIIARLQDKVRAQKAKLRQREAVLIRQEELIEEKERALFALRQQLVAAQEGTAASERACSELRGKLATLGKEHEAATREVKALTAVRRCGVVMVMVVVALVAARSAHAANPRCVGRLCRGADGGAPERPGHGVRGGGRVWRRSGWPWRRHRLHAHASRAGPLLPAHAQPVTR